MIGPLFVPGNGAARMDASGLPDLLLDVALPMALVALVSGYLARRDRRGRPMSGTDAADR